MAHAIPELATVVGEDTLLPFFVYGTLQTGFRNHANVVRGRMNAVQPASLPGAIVYHFDVGFPGMYRTAEATAVVHGQLLYFAEDVYAAVLLEMDALESEGLARWRQGRVTTLLVQAIKPEPPITCTTELSQIVHTRVEGGDWASYMRAHGLLDAADDWSATLAQSTGGTTTTSSTGAGTGIEHRPAVPMMSVATTVAPL